MGVALIGIPEQVGDQKDIRFEEGQDPGSAPLVQLEDRQVFFRLAFYKWKLKRLCNFCNNLDKMKLHVFKHFNVVIMNIRISALHIMLG